MLKASPSAEMKSLMLSADTRGLQSRAPLILTASVRGTEHAKMRRDIITKFFSKVLLNFLLRASVGVVTGWLRTGGMSSRSSKSLSDAGFVKDWYWALFLSFFLDRERFLDRLEVLGATPASVWPPLFRSDVGSEVGSFPREVDLAF